MGAELKIIQPADGDVLNHHDGVETADALRITVRGKVQGGSAVTVNGAPASVSGDTFLCDVTLLRRRNVVIAESRGERDEILVWWDRGSVKRYRFSVDDNIEFLKDLGLNPGAYASLFDHWYLAFWREMHRQYGTKIHINIYYQTEGFDLTQMPDKWKEEWQENATWLHLSFHALQDRPERPYRNATYMQLAHDYDLVCGHIRRFAGNEVLTKTTTIHWAECQKEAGAALRDRGIEQLIGLFWVQGYEGPCTTGYYLSREQCEHCDSRGAWFDRETGLMFIRCTSVVNAIEVEKIASHLDERTSMPQTAEMVELLIHEQYFRKELSYYQPTAMEKVRAALDWVSVKGYKPVFWSDGFLGTPAS
jgi:hypothetical protein